MKSSLFEILVPRYQDAKFFRAPYSMFFFTTFTRVEKTLSLLIFEFLCFELSAITFELTHA